MPYCADLRRVLETTDRIAPDFVMDTRSPEQRRRIMQAVKRKDTGPELTVRHMLHSAGYRYRLHCKGLPGKPDIVFPARKKAIFVHGCFWHAHGCVKGRAPKSRLNYWAPKLARNVARDTQTEAALVASGWEVLTVWQCETTDMECLWRSIQDFLGSRTIRSTCLKAPARVEIREEAGQA